MTYMAGVATGMFVLAGLIAAAMWQFGREFDQ